MNLTTYYNAQGRELFKVAHIGEDVDAPTYLEHLAKFQTEVNLRPGTVGPAHLADCYQPEFYTTQAVKHLWKADA